MSSPPSDSPQTVNIVERTGHSVHGLALLEMDSVWLSFSRPWWDLRAWLWWLLSPGEKKWMLIRKNGRIHRIRAVRLTKNLLRIGAKV